MKEDDLAAERRADELGRTLEAYARARLSPDEAASARMRSRVMREANLVSRSASPVDSGEAAPAALAPARPGRRSRGFLALLAAAFALLALTVGSVAAAPGGPLYAARLAIEEALLPADAEARADAEIRRLDARLAEVLQAAGSRNTGGVASALDAYHAIVDDALAAAGSSSDEAGRLEDALERHLAVLQSLLESAQPPAQDALRHAIERSGEVAGKIPGPPPHANPGQGSPGGPDRTDNPDKTTKPDKTAEPAKTPAPATETTRPTPRAGAPSTQPAPPAESSRG